LGRVFPREIARTSWSTPSVLWQYLISSNHDRLINSVYRNILSLAAWPHNSQSINRIHIPKAERHGQLDL
jgi:hypothetical protein